MNPTLANTALHLAMEWGPDWLKPTQSRLKALHPELSDAELDEYDAIARAVMKLGFDYVYASPECERQAVAAIVRGRFPWVSDQNIARLHSQGVYYAMK